VAVAALEEAMEHIDMAAFLLAPSGEVLLCNAAGSALRMLGPHTDAELRRAVAGELPTLFALHAVEVRGEPDHHLVLLRNTRSSRLDRARAAARKWGLTTRQSEVLGELAEGRTNRQIAAALGCAVSTVELHVTAIFEKSGCNNRAAVVAMLWGEVDVGAMRSGAKQGRARTQLARSRRTTRPR
jgi:DNA-binding NarL/FixJ family response regulator